MKPRRKTSCGATCSFGSRVLSCVRRPHSSKSKHRSIGAHEWASDSSRALLAGRGVTTTGRKPSTKAAHRSLRGQDGRGAPLRRSVRAAA